MSAKRNAATRERRPRAEAPSTGIATDQGAKSTLDGTAYAGLMSEYTENWQDRANDIAAWLPTATREAVEAFAMRHFQRAESAAWCIAEEHRRDRLLAQREASLAISAAVDWTRQSTVASFQELQRRRGVMP